MDLFFRKSKVKELINSGISAKELLESDYGKDFKRICHNKFVKENKSNVVWRYMRMDVLEKIFPPKILKNDKENEDYQDGNIMLRFTNIRFLNDPSEGLVLRNFFKKHRKKLEECLLRVLPEDSKEIIYKKAISGDELYLDGRYILSASYLKDSFAFWNKEYAGLDGIAIGLKNLTLRRITEKENGLFFQDVVYVDSYADELDEETLEHIEEFAYRRYFDYNLKKMLFKDFSFNLTGMLSGSYIYKEKSWKCECETRFVIDAIDDDREERYFEIKKSKIKMEIDNNKIKKTCYKVYDKDVVSSIMLGPECNNEQVNVVKEYLDKNGYDNILVERSHAFDLRDRQLTN